jgi:hypothetical protein
MRRRGGSRNANQKSKNKQWIVPAAAIAPYGQALLFDFRL